jgi:hypothetical protein
MARRKFSSIALKTGDSVEILTQSDPDECHGASLYPSLGDRSTGNPSVA